MTNENVNWTEKVLEMNEIIMDEMDKEQLDLENILISIQTTGVEPLEPAIIKKENETFLDIYVIGMSSGKLTPTAVLKKNIQSIGILGSVNMSDDVNIGLCNANEESDEDVGLKGLYY